jgi:hypothetical protein
MAPLLKIEGLVQLWSYAVGHKRLLLRSVRSASRATQVDILFKDVALIHIPSSLNDLEVSEVPRAEMPAWIDLEGATITDDMRFYRLRGRHCVAFVVAAVVVWDEREAAYGDQSVLLS